MNKIDALNYQLVINLFRVLHDVEIKQISPEEAIGYLSNLRKIYYDDMVNKLEDIIKRRS